MTRGFRLLLPLLLLLPGALQAQLGIKVVLDRNTYVRYEPVMLGITIRNYSGNGLNFGVQPITIGDRVINSPPEGSFELELMGPDEQTVAALPWRDKQGELVTDEAGKPLPYNPLLWLELPAGSAKTLPISITSHYDLREAGTYRARVRIGHRRFTSDYASDWVTFKVIEAAVEWQARIGVPGHSREAEIPTRTYVLFSFDDPAGSYYGVRVEDERFVYAVQRLGRKAQGAQPEHVVDSRSRLHLLIQTHPRVFTYWVYDHEGKERQLSRYTVEPTPPRLVRDPDIGRVMVVGGTLAVEGLDYNLTAAPVMSVETEGDTEGTP